MRNLRTNACWLASLLAVLIVSSASAAVNKVICVPWQGDITKQHTAIAGLAVTVKGVIKTTAAGTYYYKWVYGDSTDSGVQSVVVSSGGNTPLQATVEASHAYAGAVGTPLTAQLQVADNNALAGAMTDNYLVKIESDSLDSRINIAIDIGLWYTYKQGIKGDGVNAVNSFLTMDSQPFVYWFNSVNSVQVAGTASAVQAFEINGSLESGNFDEDPYAEYVAGGLKFLIMGYALGSCSTTMNVVDNGTLDLTGNGVPQSITLEMLNAQCGSGGTFELFLNGVSLGTFLNSGVCSCTPGAMQTLLLNNAAALTAAWNANAAKIIRVTYSGGSAAYNSRTDVKIDWGAGNVQTLCVRSAAANCFGSNLCDGYDDHAFDNSLDLSSVHAYTVTSSTTCVQNPILRALTLSAQHGQNPDSNGNGIGIEAYDTGSGHPPYQGGIAMDAIIASGTPAKSSGRDFVGSGHIATYAEIIQDMIDMYAYGEYDGNGSGSWQYSWNAGNDNSASQWAAIGMIPAQKAPWNATVPQWVKDYDNGWLNQSFYTSGSSSQWGHFGYQSSSPLGCGSYPCPNSIATTPSGMVQLSFDDMTTADSRWVKSEQWIAENWDTGDNWLNGTYSSLYSMYAMTKAMRLAKPSPVVNFSATGFDWYRGNSSHLGIAKVLSDNLIANGSWAKTGSYYWWEGQPMATEWAVIMLKPTLFAASPVACFTAHPNPSFSDQPVNFDPGCSGHSDPAKSIANLVKFEWDWDNDGTYDQSTATPIVVAHSFHCPVVPCHFPVTLKVTDDAGLTATFQLTIDITDPPHPPVSKPGGPYLVSLCAGDALGLDGSASFDPDNGLHQAGCATCPNDTITAYDWDLDGAPFDYVSAHGATVNLPVGAAPFTTFFASPGSYNIGLRVTDNTALAYPASGKPNLTDEAFAVVNVYAAGPCTLTAAGGCSTVTLNWNSVDRATGYDVYRSITGPNTGFGFVGTTALLTYTDAVTMGTQYWYRVIAKSGANVLSMSPAVSITDTFDDCGCIRDLSIQAKNLLVQLNWSAIAGASCYNVYRSTSPNVALTAANRIKACVTTPYYVDTPVVNNTKYYYKVTEVKNGVEVCVSSEVNGTPTAPRR